jgi:tight adherence protein B
MRWLDTAALEWLGGALLLGGIFATTATVVGAPAGLPRRYWARYVVLLETKLRRMYNWTSGQRIAAVQAAAIVGCFALRVIVELPAWYLFAACAVLLPPWWIERLRAKRVLAIEAQIDAFLLALSNALKATPSIGDAFLSVGALLSDPIRQEVTTAVKEMRFGASLDQALLLMASRVGSRQLDSALSAILIGRQVGGNLPKILDSTAASLREMARLEGVVRTKTAEGKMQVWVLAFVPLVLVLALNVVDKGHFDPLTESLVGYALIGIAVLLWGAALIATRRILSVEV